MDIPTLTFNQWIMAGSIVFFGIILTGWVLLCTCSRNFRQSLYRDIETSPRLTHQVHHHLSNQELYYLWFVNIRELAENMAGRGRYPVGPDHFISVSVWILFLICTGGFLTGYYNRDMWGFFAILIVAATFIYSEIKVTEAFRKPRDD